MAQISTFTIRPLILSDQPWVAQFLDDHWGGPLIVTRGQIYDGSRLPGFAAVRDGQIAGLVTYRIEADSCEIVSLDSLAEGIGIGSTLIEAVRQRAVTAGCRRLWLITTNDNLAAIRFYQKRGFELAAIHRNALDVSRKLKPQIPLTGIDGIPLRDEIELEIPLEHKVG